MKPFVRENVPLAPFTTLGIGGPGRYSIHADNENIVLEGIQLAKDRALPILILGGGSNLLIADEGFPGLVLRMGIRGLNWSDEGDRVRLASGAGEDWDEVVAQCVARNLFGVECLSGIPGLVGGTPIQNVGAYGQEISETLSRVRVYDRETDRFMDLDRSDCGFAYRSSVFNTTAIGRYIVLNVEYVLSKNGSPALRYPDLKEEFKNTPQPSLSAVRDAVRRIRARKAMLLQPGDPDCRSAGSFFKNPIVDEGMLAGENVPRYPSSPGKVKISAAWLIEHSGIHRGFSMGPAGVSTKHTLALVNKGGASASDVIALARYIRQRVEDRFGVRLVPEPVFVGFDEGTGF